MFTCPNCMMIVGQYDQSCSCCGYDLSKVKWACRNAPLGNPEAQMFLGGMYKHGLYVERNHQKYIEWTLKSAKNGVVSSMAEIGACFWDMAQEQNNESLLIKGLYWLIEARNHGDAGAANALNNLGIVDAVFVGSPDAPSLIELREK